MIRLVVSTAILMAALPANAGDQLNFCAASNKIIAGGIIRKVDAPGGKLAHVWVGSTWHNLDFDMKTNAVGISSACYYGRVSPSDLTIVRDIKTGNRIGTYTPHRLSLD